MKWPSRAAVVSAGAAFIGVFAVAGAALAIAVADIVTVSGPSMERTLYDGDQMLIVRTQLLFRVPGLAERILHRGQVVIVNEPISERLIVKRIVGGPGDRVRIDRGRLLVNEQAVVEVSTIKVVQDSWPADFEGDGAPDRFVDVPDARYFVLADNRITSMDSRVFGTVGPGDIQGLVMFAYSSGARPGNGYRATRGIGVVR